MEIELFSLILCGEFIRQKVNLPIPKYGYILKPLKIHADLIGNTIYQVIFSLVSLETIHLGSSQV